MNRTLSIVPILRRFRDLAGITQKQMAVKTGISLATIKRIERGARVMSIDDYYNYLDVLEISHIDVLIAMKSGDYHVEREIASLARKLPKTVQLAHLQYLMVLVDSR